MLHKNFQEDYTNSRRFPGVVDTLLFDSPCSGGGNPLEFRDEAYPAKTRGMGYRVVKIS